MNYEEVLPEKRKEIYLKLAKAYSKEGYKDATICLDLESLYNGYKIKGWIKNKYNTFYHQVIKLFPEIEDFVVERTEEFTNETRVIALLFAYHMIENE